MREDFLPLGKLKGEYLERFLKNLSQPDPRVVIGPKLGEDAAVIDFGDRYLVAASDPVTFATEEIGWYAININANDVAAMGAKPRWFLATILLPENKATLHLVDDIFNQLQLAGKELGIAIVGGHTEITRGIEHPIVVGGLIGEVEPDKVVSCSGAEIGDDIVLIKGIAIEGTSIIAREKENELVASGYSEEFISHCQGFIHNPGISILREALFVNEATKINCMHDPTESGLAGALREIALASAVGVEVWRERVLIYPETQQLCDHFGLDPLGLISSGALLATLEPSETLKLTSKLSEAKMSFSLIGKVVEKERGLKFKDLGGIPLPVFDQDEITRLYSDQ